MITVLKYYGITMVFVLVERVDVYIFPDWICMYSKCEQSAKRHFNHILINLLSLSGRFVPNQVMKYMNLKNVPFFFLFFLKQWKRKEERKKKNLASIQTHIQTLLARNTHMVSFRSRTFFFLASKGNVPDDSLAL